VGTGRVRLARTDAPVWMCERGAWGECWCTCYSTVRCIIVNRSRSCRIRRVCIFCEHERGSDEMGSTKCYTQKHKCQFHQNMSKTGALHTVAADVQVSPKQPRSNHDLKYLKSSTTLCNGPSPQDGVEPHHGQNQVKEYWVLKKVEVCGCGQLW
jgi:hypothetical protein